MIPSVVALVRDNSKLRGMAKAVLYAIATRVANIDGSGAYPSIETLAKASGFCIRVVQKALREARERDELEIRYNTGPNGTNQYRIKVENFGGVMELTPAPMHHHPRTRCAQGIFL